MKKSHQMYLLLAILLCCIGNTSYAQKRPLDITEITEKNWAYVGSPVITNDGNYCAYAINNQPLGSKTLVVIKAANSTWQHELPGIGDVSFTDDSRKAIFMKGDSLSLLNLGTGSTEYIPGVAYFQLFKQGKSEWLAIQKSSANQELLLRNLASGKQASYEGISQFLVSPTGNAVVLIKQAKRDSATETSLYWLSLPEHKLAPVFQSMDQLGNFTFDNQGKQLAFVSEKNEKSIWLYQNTSAKATLLKPKANGATSDLELDGLSDFSKDGSRLFLKLKKPDLPKANPDAVKLDVWSYTDAKVQSQQLIDLKAPAFGSGRGAKKNNLLAVVDFNKQHLLQLEHENEYAENLFNDTSDDWLVLWKNAGGDYSEDHWNKSSKPAVFLLSTRNGERRPLPGEISHLSPNGQYALGRDEENNIYSYELSTGIRRNLTKSLPIPTGNEGDDQPYDIKSRGLSIAGWFPDSKSAILYDKYDIWQVDPSGAKTPVNLTNGFGRKHKIAFRFMEDFQKKSIARDQQVLLTAFKLTTKENGFYKITFGKGGDPQKLTMGHYVYYVPYHGLGHAPLKAKGGDWYLVHRESASESPNYFMTRDFKVFTPLSAVYPEREYNWVTSELVNFKTIDGKDEQGVLYKPTDFDPNKKYPLIIHYYDKMSQGLNHYRSPGLINNYINIPLFVSKGYLVFTPDIHYTIGETGESALNSVAGAAKHLMKLPYVDAKKMGIQGHSFGGYETNYIVTHTNLFAAAMSSSGFSNLVSSHGSVTFGSGNAYFAHWAERHQGRIGHTLWQRPDLYIKNSPVFQADKVSTPLLMMSNKEDGIVNVSQGIELFTALRRLGKKAWMLQYDGQAHSVYKKASIDYTIRITQFFDHYLKGAPAPQWMLRGIPARMKGVDDGLALDETGASPGPGLLIEK